MFVVYECKRMLNNQHLLPKVEEGRGLEGGADLPQGHGQSRALPAPSRLQQMHQALRGGFEPLTLLLLPPSLIDIPLTLMLSAGGLSDVLKDVLLKRQGHYGG